MKLKFLALTLAMAASTLAVNAQEQKKSNDIFVGGGVGIMSAMTPGFNTPSFYLDAYVGKYITPVWGVRAGLGGLFATLDARDGNAVNLNGDAVAFKNKKFGELNVDAMLSLTNIFADDIAKFNVYLFAGPTVNFSRTGTKFSDVQDANVFLVENDNSFKLRAGASAGLGLAYSITDAFALGLEGRFSVTPSMFGDADAYRKAAGNSRLTLNGIWAIGGQRGKVARAAAAAAAAGYITKEAAEAMVDEALEKNPKIVEKVVEKEVVKYVDKVVYKDAPVSTPVFFQIGKSNIDSKDKARIKLLAEAINAAQEQCTYEVAGYADKKTGSAKYNQQLSEKRAQAVYDLLVEYGVAADKLEVKGYGGVEPMFDNNDTLSRCVIVKKK